MTSTETGGPATAELERLRGQLAERERELTRERRLRRTVEAREHAHAERAQELGRELLAAARRLFDIAGERVDGSQERAAVDEAASPPADTPAQAPMRTGAPTGGPVPLPFTLTALGGAEEVGGSALLVETPHGTVLLDAGQRVKGEYGDPDGGGMFHFLVPGIDRLDAILISHAHIDHVGSLPVVYREHARVQSEPPGVWMSAPTIDLARVMLYDSAKVQGHRARTEQRIAELAESDLSGGGLPRRAYERHEVNVVLEAAQPAPPDRAFQIPGTELLVKFQPVSHVLGSCAIHIKHLPTGATLLYTGDLGPYGDPQETLHERVPGHTLDVADVVVMESTYGGKAEDPDGGGRRALSGRERMVQRLADTAARAFAREGFVLLPAFSLGRTQELLRLLAGDRLPEAPIYVGGMGEQITNLYGDWAKRDDGTWVPPGRFASGVTSINRWVLGHPNFGSAAAEVVAHERPGYVICSPAMLSGGWSRAFLEEMVEDPRHAVALTGYMPPHAGGIRHIDRVAQGRPLHLPDGDRTVRCDWVSLRGLSAHAPGGDLRRFALDVARGRPTAFACMHGDRSAQRELADWIAQHVDSGSAHSMERGLPWNPQLPG